MTAREDAANRFPPTMRTVSGKGVSQRLVFDPSMKHHPHAMRATDPRFTDPGRGALWYGKRMIAMAAALAAVADCDFAEHLVLRGSVLMKLWFGAAAREPGDLDFVVDHSAWPMADARTAELFEQVAAGAEAVARRDGAVRIDAGGAIGDEIWTYDRVPGRRLVLPWSADGCPDGSVQLDFVFGEKLPEAAPRTELWFALDAPAVVRAVSPELSLAWKLLWLVDDMYPQAKDFYDAVLLAEAVHLPRRLLGQVVKPSAVASILWSDPHWSEFEDDDDWADFSEDHPEAAAGGFDALLQRLRTALAPTFAEGSDDAGS